MPDIYIVDRYGGNCPDPAEGDKGADVRELLAAYAHDAWSGWMRYMFSRCEPIPPDGSGLAIPMEFVERWQRQMTTEYADLPESEKASDLAEADKMLAIINASEAANG